MTPSTRRPDDRELKSMLARTQRVIFKYPLAAQAAFTALTAEGRRFAGTSEGALWLERLQGAEQTERARLLWEILSLRGFNEGEGDPLPSVFLEALVRALKLPSLEPLLAGLFDGRL
jgi:hypothetical protein